MTTRILKSGTWILYNFNTVEGVEFDREKVSLISVAITCTDKGIQPQSNTQIVTIHVADVNDNKPTFPKMSYVFPVEENIRAGIVVGQVVAQDLDGNENGRVSYEIESKMKEQFSINNKGQIHTNIELDREKISSYEFKVIAKDNGLTPQSGSCTVKVIVTDVNDCKPEVEKQFTFEIVESRGFSQIHVNLGKIDAKDADLGLNGTLNFKIANSYSARDFGKSLLQITSDGQLSIYGNVDRETMKTIHLEIIVFDNGRPSLSSVTTVIVNVLDLNDNKPRFTFPNYPNNNFINISLQSSVGSVVAVIEATDPDNGNNGTVSYKLMGGDNIKSFFELTQSGQMILIKPLAERRLNPDRLLIHAVDGGDPALSEITTLYLRYYNNNKLSSIVRNDKKSSLDFRNDKDLSKETPNVNLLYGLAAVLIVIFFIALVALFFIFAKGRTHISQGEKCGRNRKNYSQKLHISTNELKGNDDLVDPSLCDRTEMSLDPKENYTHLMYFKDPNYNVLYPRILSKSDLIDHPPQSNINSSSTLSYFPLQHQSDLNAGAKPMRVLVNNLSPLTQKAQTLTHPGRMYKDSVESLCNDSSYNSALSPMPTKDEVNCGTFVPTCSIGYPQSYITSTFV